jgi:hypothetical protein
MMPARLIEDKPERMKGKSFKPEKNGLAFLLPVLTLLPRTTLSV